MAIYPNIVAELRDAFAAYREGRLDHRALAEEMAARADLFAALEEKLLCERLSGTSQEVEIADLRADEEGMDVRGFVLSQIAALEAEFEAHGYGPQQHSMDKIHSSRLIE